MKDLTPYVPYVLPYVFKAGVGGVLLSFNNDCCQRNTRGM